MFSTSHQLFLSNKLVEDISMFNVGGIFENWDALDTQNNFRKRATGIFATIWNKAKLYKNRTTKIKTPLNLMDTVTYYNNNNIPRDVVYPKLFGWRFENDSTFDTSIILTNISSDTLTISVDSLISGNVIWEKWHSDSLFDVIDSVNYINLLTDNGTENITLLPYSINVANGNCLSDIDLDGVCDELEILGCTDVLGCNYSFESTEDDGSCIYPNNFYDCNGNCLNDIDSDGICNEIDNCPEDYNPNQDDFDSDDIGDDCDVISVVEELIHRKIMLIVDVLGREIPIPTNENLLIYIYDDGSIEKKYIIK